MFKKLIASLFAVAMVASCTFAAEVTPYFSVKAGIANLYANTDLSNFDMDVQGVQYDNTLMGAAAIGMYVFGFRAEAEYSYRGVSSQHYKGPVAGATGAAKSELKQDIQSFMVNLYYDFETTFFLAPFVNVGAGVSRVKLDKVGTGTISNDMFTYSAGGGVSYVFNEHINLDLGYRFVKIEDMNIGDGVKLKQFSNDVYLGMRYKF